MNGIFELASSIEIRVRPDLLTRSHASRAVMVSRLKTVVVVHSMAAASQLLRGVTWHDEESEHCRTWSDGCRCDLGDES